MGLGSPSPYLCQKEAQKRGSHSNGRQKSKVWGNIMELIEKIEKTDTMTKSWERQRQECRRMKNECQVQLSTAMPSCFRNCYISNSNCTQCVSLSAFRQPLLPGPDPLGKKTPPATTSRCQIATVPNVSLAECRQRCSRAQIY